MVVQPSKEAYDALLNRVKALEEEVARLKAEEEAKLATEFAAEGEAEE